VKRSRQKLKSIQENSKEVEEEKRNNESSNQALKLLKENQNFSIRSEGLVPNIVKSCCKYISENGLHLVGIFRVESSKKRIKELKETFDSGKRVNLDEECTKSYTINDVACILKEYLRSLQEPLLTRDLYTSFLLTTRLTSNDEEKAKRRLEIVRHLICLLPIPNRDTLECVLKLLDKVRQNSSVNKMDAFNLAMVFGPTLLKKHKTSLSSSNSSSSNSKLLNDLSLIHSSHVNSDKYNLIDDIDSVIMCTKYLIENQNLIFNVSIFSLSDCVSSNTFFIC
jgi:hypothetical protein